MFGPQDSGISMVGAVSGHFHYRCSGSADFIPSLRMERASDYVRLK